MGIGKPKIKNNFSIVKKQTFLEKLWANKAFLILMTPGIIMLIINSYLPLFGVTIAFKKIDYEIGLFKSPWIGFKNFEFLFATNDIWVAIKNTLLYNSVFIITGLICSLFIALVLNELTNQKTSKSYQTILIMPSFLSIIIIASIVSGLLGEKTGFINSQLLGPLGIDPIKFYKEPIYWYFILPLVNIWKGAGIGSILYLATICGISPELYEAAVLDGAGKCKQAMYVTLPMLKPMIGIQTILAVGGMFRADIGMFQQVTMDGGLIRSSIEVIDTFVYRSLVTLGDVGMSSAASFMQSLVGCLLLVSVNLIVRKVDPDSSLF